MLRKLAPVLVLAATVLGGCERNLPVDDKDRAVVLRAADLIPFGYGLEKTEPYETFTKTRYLDGSHELTYEFETPDSEEENALYMNVTISVEKSTSDAWATHGAQDIGLGVGLKTNGITKREVKDFYKYGDSSTFYVLEKDGHPIGNAFTVRHGKRVYMLVLSGMYFDDAASWKELIEEKLETFSEYAPT